VNQIDKGVKRLQKKAGHNLFGSVKLTEGPAAGQAINYFETPFGTDVELISYPRGMAYEAKAAVDLWNPHDNKAGPRGAR